MRAGRYGDSGTLLAVFSVALVTAISTAFAIRSRGDRPRRAFQLHDNTIVRCGKVAQENCGMKLSLCETGAIYFCQQNVTEFVEEP
jgi:hypothetical protein